MLDYIKMASLVSLLILDHKDYHFLQTDYSCRHSFDKVKQIFGKDVADKFEAQALCLFIKN